MIESIKQLFMTRTNNKVAGPSDMSRSTLKMEPPPEDRVIFRRVHKWFGSLEVLAGVDLEVNEGEVVVIIGPSGSGKTTVLRCLAGLEEIQSGEIYVFGHQVTHAWKLGGEVGFVFQQFNLFPHMTALQNVMLALRKARRMDQEAARKLALAMLDKVGLADKADARPSRLSGGQQQRVAIARSLAMQPKLMLFDEVTSALDRELVAEVLRTMKQLAEQGMTMVVVTHELSFAEQVADRLIFMDKGQIVEQGPPAQLLHHPHHERTRQFLGKISVEL
jgi:ABC-type polar amino acid transport system ATPase subunit